MTYVFNALNAFCISNWLVSVRLSSIRKDNIAKNRVSCRRACSSQQESCNRDIRRAEFPTDQSDITSAFRLESVLILSMSSCNMNDAIFDVSLLCFWTFKAVFRQKFCSHLPAFLDFSLKTNPNSNYVGQRLYLGHTNKHMNSRKMQFYSSSGVWWLSYQRSRKNPHDILIRRRSQVPRMTCGRFHIDALRFVTQPLCRSFGYAETSE